MHTPRPPAYHQQGFTLVELLVVIAIIGVLAAILIPSYNGAQKRSWDTAAMQCGRAVITAQTSIRAQTSTYLGPLDQLGEDAIEACQGVRIQPNHTLADNPAATTSQTVAVSATNYAFQVFHPRGSGYYIYNHQDGTAATGSRLNRLFAW